MASCAAAVSNAPAARPGATWRRQAGKAVATAASARRRLSVVAQAAATATDRVKVGESGLEVSAVGLGAWSWGDRSRYWQSEINKPENLTAYQAMIESGIDFLDTAEVYGFGYSEEFIGEFMRQTGTKPQICTKFAPLPWRQTPGSLVGACKKSLGRLGVDQVALYIQHWPGFFLNAFSNDAFLEGLAQVHEQGLAQAVGSSNFNADRVRKAAKFLKGRGTCLSSNQVQYSLLYRAPEQNGVLEACRENGVTLVAYSPLCQGLLTGKYSRINRPTGPRAQLFTDARYESVQVLLDCMRAISKESGGKTLGQIAINWTMCKGALPIPGAKRAEQVAEIAGAMGWRLSEGEVAELDRAAAQAPAPAGQPAAPASEADADLVEFLPGFGELRNDTVYAGYLPVNKSPSRELFYTFVERREDAANSPLILWLQGGPGCSSVGIGFLQEMGPFMFDNRRNVSRPVLARNPLSWSNVANVLYLDTPAFTGFSRSSDNVTDRSWGDGNTTTDNMLALRAFYQRFPAMRQRPLFVAGQGYAGHFVPMLAERIVSFNAQNLTQLTNETINLKGIMVGNPWSDPGFDNAGAVAFWYSQGLISRGTFVGLKAECSAKDTVLWMTQGNGGNVTGKCATFRDAALRETASINLYGLNGFRCAMQPGYVPPGLKGVLPLAGDEASLELGVSPVAFQPGRPAGPPNPYYDACVSYRAWEWLNNPEVQEALHAIGPEEDAREFRSCDPSAVTFSLEDMLTSVVPVYRSLINSSVPILIYSGTTDAVMPSVGTRTWVESMQLPVAKRIQAYKDPVGDTVGFWQEYQGLTFATLMDAGHSAPMYKPQRVLVLIKRFTEQWAGGGGGAAPSPTPAPAKPAPAPAAVPAPKP
ncbi:Aldo keto reductase [Micractinium conductrix]|uniref:Aldo keto reductase n=1 Tax=Micractinium conductrix TaxID=554055 RepID=A0A2P6VMP7_9CHLO|nr:Aldo keto reductase [Micractinium conductrix]|eukprot:PSC75376.1 Aldo keto reductase [Micractinium conductrix]